MAALGIIIFLVLIVLIVNFLKKFFGLSLRGRREELLDLSAGREDTVGQVFILLGVIFFGETLLLLNKNLAGDISPYWIVFITLLFSFYVAYSTESLYSVIFGVVLFPIWWISQSIGWAEAAQIKIPSNVVLSGLVFIVLFFYLLGRMLDNEDKWKKFAVVFELISLAMLSSFFLVFSSPYGVSLLEGNRGSGTIFLSFPLTFFLVLFIVADLFLLCFRVFREKKRNLLSGEILPLLFLLLFFTSLIFIKIPELFGKGGYSLNPEDLTRCGVAWTVILIVLTFLQVFWLLVLGYQRKERIIINLGAFFLFLFITVQYFSHFKFLNKSLFFFFGGILLLITGYLMEKGRKFYLGRISKPTV